MFYILSWGISIFSFENTVYSQSKNTKTVQNFSEPIKKITCIALVLLVLLVIDAAAADAAAAAAADDDRGGGAWCCSQTRNLLKFLDIFMEFPKMLEVLGT